RWCRDSSDRRSSSRTAPGIGKGRPVAASCERSPPPVDGRITPKLSHWNDDGGVAACGPRSRPSEVARCGPRRRLAILAPVRRTQSHWGRRGGTTRAALAALRPALLAHGRPRPLAPVLGRALPPPPHRDERSFVRAVAVERPR